MQWDDKTLIEHLPEHVAVLDVEVRRVYRSRWPIPFGDESLELDYVGWKSFFLDGKSYVPKHYCQCGRQHVRDLFETIWKKKALIIGFNIFRWDYYVLNRASLSRSVSVREKLMKQAVERTFDVGNYMRVDESKSNSLHTLSLTNLGTGKLERRNPKYNENDCDLTFRLWELLVFQREYLTWVPHEEGLREGTVDVPDKDLAVLLGLERQWTYLEWHKLLSSPDFTAAVQKTFNHEHGAF